MPIFNAVHLLFDFRSINVNTLKKSHLQGEQINLHVRNNANKEEGINNLSALEDKCEWQCSQLMDLKEAFDH